VAIKLTNLQQISEQYKLKDYYYKDLNPNNGKNYYRIKCRTVSGAEVYSSIINLYPDGLLLRFNIINNPVHDMLNIRALLIHSGQPVRFRIFDASGKLMIAENRDISGDVTALDVAGLNKGVYFIHIYTVGNAATVLKFIVE
jgi:hypothetical protein